MIQVQLNATMLYHRLNSGDSKEALDISLKNQELLTVTPVGHQKENCRIEQQRVQVVLHNPTC
jgi:hypothetical protein